MKLPKSSRRNASSPVPMALRETLTVEQMRQFEALRKAFAQGPQRPDYTLESVEASGKISQQDPKDPAGARTAELRLEFSVFVATPKWVRVPLRLGELTLSARPEFAGQGKQFLHFNDRNGGYEWWIHGGEERRYKLSLTMLCPLDLLGGETVLRFTIAQATQSRLELAVPGRQAAGTKLGGRDLRVSELWVAKAGVTQFVLQGFEGPVTLSWSAQERRLIDVSSKLCAEGLLICRIDGRNRVVRTEARLLVRSFGGPFDHFRVRLPPGAKLVENDDPRVTPSRGNASGRNRGQIVDVRHDLTTEPVSLRLRTERSYNTPDDPIELAGFEVLGAVNQWGHIALQVLDDWQVDWERLGQHVRQIAISSLPDETPAEEFVAAFVYWRQPASLETQVFRPEPRVQVEPRHDIVVDPEESRLVSTLRYTVAGSKIFSVDVDCRDWEIESIDSEPEGLIDVDRIRFNLRQPLTIPFKEPKDGGFQITLHGRRERPDAATLAFALPRPDARAESEGNHPAGQQRATHAELSGHGGADPAACRGAARHVVHSAGLELSHRVVVGSVCRRFPRANPEAELRLLR